MGLFFLVFLDTTASCSTTGSVAVTTLGEAVFCLAARRAADLLTWEGRLADVDGVIGDTGDGASDETAVMILGGRKLAMVCFFDSGAVMGEAEVSATTGMSTSKFGLGGRGNNSLARAGFALTDLASTGEERAEAGSEVLGVVG